MLRSAVLAFALAVPSFALAEGLTAHGNFRHMMHTGETEGTIALDTLNAPSGWGVGATAGLRGEVVIRDGAVLIRSAADVIEALPQAAGAEDDAPGSAPELPLAPPPDKRSLRDTAALHRQILDRLGPSPLAEDQLIRDLNRAAHLVAPAITQLEFEGRVRRQAGGLLSRTGTG
jgi:hypothetical protein